MRETDLFCVPMKPPRSGKERKRMLARAMELAREKKAKRRRASEESSAAVRGAGPSSEAEKPGFSGPSRLSAGKGDRGDGRATDGEKRPVLRRAAVHFPPSVSVTVPARLADSDSAVVKGAVDKLGIVREGSAAPKPPAYLGGDEIVRETTSEEVVDDQAAVLRDSRSTEIHHPVVLGESAADEGENVGNSGDPEVADPGVQDPEEAGKSDAPVMTPGEDKLGGADGEGLGSDPNLAAVEQGNQPGDDGNAPATESAGAKPEDAGDRGLLPDPNPAAVEESNQDGNAPATGSAAAKSEDACGEDFQSVRESPAADQGNQSGDDGNAHATGSAVAKPEDAGGEGLGPDPPPAAAEEGNQPGRRWRRRPCHGASHGRQAGGRVRRGHPVCPRIARGGPRRASWGLRSCPSQGANGAGDDGTRQG